MGHIEHNAKTRTEKLIDALEANTAAVKENTTAQQRAEAELRLLRQQIESGRVSSVEGL